jgi:hypothetical protein
MCFARRFFLLSLVIAAFATTGRAEPLRSDGVTWGAALWPMGEINPVWTAVGSCLLAAALILGHSAKLRK